MKISCTGCSRSLKFDETKYPGPAISFKCPACGALNSIELPGITPEETETLTGTLSQQETAALAGLHRMACTPAISDRIKAILCLNRGLSPEETSEILMLSTGDILSSWKNFREHGTVFFTGFSSGAEISDEDAGKLAAVLVPDTIGLMLACDLVPFVDPGAGGTILESIRIIREKITRDYGWTFGPVRILDDLSLQPGGYRIIIRGFEAARGTVVKERVLAIAGLAVKKKVDAPHSPEPVFGLPSLWLPADKEEAAIKRGYTVARPEMVIISHIEETILRHAGRLAGIKETSAIMDKLREKNPHAVAEAEAAPGFSLTLFASVIKLLLEERVSVADPVLILETITSSLRETCELPELAACARIALAPQLVLEFLIDNELSASILPPELEEKIYELAAETDNPAGLLPEERKNITDRIKSTDWPHPVILTDRGIRLFVYRLFADAFPLQRFTVLCEAEIPSGVSVSGYRPLEFSEISLMGDESICRITALAGNRLMALALKSCEEEIREIVFTALPEDEAARLREEIEFMGPVHLSSVETAQRDICRIISGLIQTGEIFRPGSATDELVV